MNRLYKTLVAGWLVLIGAMMPGALSAAPFAAFVMDGRTGKEIYSQNADARLHPASLTKMMTLYMAFTAIERGQVRLDSRFTVSTHAASQPPSRLGLRPGQQIELRYLIRAAAVKSANDAATVIGEGLAGSEAQFGAQMTQMARALGMRNSNFRNANGLTQEGHYSSARDLSILGRRLFYDFPQYYSIFSRRTADAGVATVASTNKRFLDSYAGADGIKTGYTRAAGFNLTASAQRGSKRIIATVLGGQSTAQRNAVMAQLLDAGFGRAPAQVREIRPEAPAYLADKKRVVKVARAAPEAQAPVATARPVRGSTVALAAVPVAVPAQPKATARVAAAPSADAQAEAVAGAVAAGRVAGARPSRRPDEAPAAVKVAEAPAPADPKPAAEAAAPRVASVSADRPTRAPRKGADASADPAPAATGKAAKAKAPRTPGSTFAAEAAPAPAADTKLARSAKPVRKSDTVILAAMEEEEGDRSEPEATEIVSRPSTGRGKFAINVGRFKTKAEAEQLLLRLALQESAVLDSATRRVGNTPKGWEATFTGLSRDSARLACDKLAARSQRCRVLGN
ncbi:D-alanyl-D-alanine carboxypeptidase family protein [Paracoccus sanguinis]|uniref:D-alanyl-D-alanine carboxypeptidase n=1 Tax=Paracoccus sanguinis TaxID=1545044 RepID=A0A1H2WIE2_9RHOB|nr:D-alanyl-D-alanine carboxypeptidase [Paracoccus sanguinis]